MNDEINRNQGMAVSDPKGAISDALHAREVSNGNVCAMHAKFFLYKILKPPRREKVAAVQFTIQFTQYAIQNPYGGVVHGTRPYLAKRASDTYA